MTPRVDYEQHGRTYARHRRPDPRLAARIHSALGDARTVVNVGAGTGSYEPDDRWVLAVEPMACVTIHHWDPVGDGIRELRRVARGPVVVFTFALEGLPAWQHDPLAEAVAVELPRFGPIEDVAAVLGGRTRIETIPTPGDCEDGFFEAFWNRPEALLDPEVRGAQSVWTLLPPGAEERIVARLAEDLASGAWDAEHGWLREHDALDAALRLVVSERE